MLPSGSQCSTVVRFCPILFELHVNGPDPAVSLPFRMIVAVGTDHDVILYDTQQIQPFAYFKDIHYTRLTDLTWSEDGLLLVASSTDGYCALITFEPNELGVQYVKEESEVEESVLDVSGCEELEKDENVDFVKPKRLNLLEQWAVKTPKKKSASTSSNNEIEDDNVKRKREDEPGKSAVACKRIKPIRVEDKKIEKEASSSTHKQEVVCKRIKPIRVEDKKINNEIMLSKKENPSPRGSPLLNFLKRVSKEKNDSKNTTVDVSADMIDLTVDENEARDAWKCETDDVKEQKITVVNDDEYTEDFSLHLENTNSQISPESKNEQDSSDSKNDEADKNHSHDLEDTEVSIHGGAVNITDVKENVKEKEREEKSNKVDETESQTKDKQENCVQIKDNDINVPQNTNETMLKKTVEIEKVPQVLTNTVDKTSVPKKRVPLITLSSPKHKKKLS